MTAILRERPGLVPFAAALVVGSAATFIGEVGPAMMTAFTLTAIAAIVVGEQMPTTLTLRVIAPLTTAPALGLILAPLSFDGRTPGAASVLGIIWLSMLVGALLARAWGRSFVEGSLGARFLGMVVTAHLARGITVEGRTLVDWAFQPDTRHAFAALGLLAAALTGAVVERLIEGATTWFDEGGSLRAIAADEMRPLLGIAAATASTGPLIALAQPVLDWVAIPLLLLPVLLTHLAVQRAIAIRLALEESVYAISRLTEVAGRTRSGHSRRVAELAVEIGRAMELEAEGLRDVERTALLHDVGQLGLDDPIPGGATVNASPHVLDEIAQTSTRVVVSSPLLAEFAPLIDQVRTPFRQSREFGDHIPLPSRIVRVANAWDDITEGTWSKRARSVALERLHLGLGYDYDPEVVAALERTLP